MRDPIRRKNDKVKVFPLYGQNMFFDYESIVKERLKNKIASLQVNEEDNTVIMNDPYTNRKKVSFEHAWTFDPIVRLAINKKIDFVVGERPITVLDTTKEFTAASEKAAEAFNNIVGNNTLQEMKSYIDNLNGHLGFHEKLKAAVVNMKIYGRSVLHIEKFLDKEPAELKVLNSQKLGEVAVDNDSWNLHSVKYSDISTDNDNVLYADELIYFTNVDYNVVPDSLGYGYSEVDPIVHVSECNRIIDATDLKEINAKLWGAFGIIKFLETKDPVAMRKFLEEFKPGTWTATDANIEIDIKEIKNSLKELVDERNENDLRIIRAIGVPSFLMGFEKITNRACYSADTQTLTEYGWKYYWEISKDEKIATFNPNTESLEYYKPNGFYLYPYKGEMIHFKSRRQDILVTPEHDMWRFTTKWHKDKAKDLYKLGRVDFRAHVKDIENKEVAYHELSSIEYRNYNTQKRTEQVSVVHMDTWLEFLGYYLSEGTRTYESNGIYHIALSQNTMDNILKVKDIQLCLDSLGFNFASYTDSENIIRWQIDNKQLHTILKNETGGNHLTKRIPRYVFDLSKRQLAIIFKALMLGDGTYSNNYMEYSTTSEGLADDVQEIAFKLGYNVKIRKQIDKRGGNRHPLFRVGISNPHNLRISNITKEDYNGFVYCFDVPNHLFITRRNGKIAIQGNTVRAVLEAWKQSTINPERAMLKNIIEPQWLNMLVANYLDVRNIKDVYVKVKQEFQDIVFETVKDLSESYLPLYEQGLISGYQLLRLLDLDYLADETKALQSKMVAEREQLKQDISARIDQVMGETSPRGDMEKSITTKMIKQQLLNDIDNRMGNQMETAISDFIRNAILKRLAKDKVEQGLADAGIE